MARNYVNELFKKGLIETMEQDFQREFPEIYAQFTISEIQSRLKMVFTTRNCEFGGYFVATNFDVKEENKPQNYQFLQTARFGVDAKSLKKWYIKWMNSHFETYKQDFLAYKTREIENEFDI